MDLAASAHVARRRDFVAPTTLARQKGLDLQKVNYGSYY
jgi:hypothetical protein